MSTIQRDDNRVPVPGGVTSVKETEGALVATPVTYQVVVSAAGAGKKNRVFKVILTSDTICKLTISDGFGEYYAAVGVPIVLDYGSVGKLQTTANTAVNVSATPGTNVGVLSLYTTE